MHEPLDHGPAPTGDPLTRIRHIVLVGLMGSGKSTVGHLVASRLGRPIHDSDEEIEARIGHTVREVRDLESTSALHDIEAAHLLEALLGDGPDVICPAASIADRDECLDALRAQGVATVWLDVDPAIAAQRFGRQVHRPSYGDDPAVFLAAQRAERGPRFASVATLVLDAGEHTPEELAAAILAGLVARTG
jgi:shikimate kinase